MENANRPNGYTVPEREFSPAPTERDEDIRVSLGSIRKEIEETNRILRRIEQGLGGKR